MDPPAPVTKAKWSLGWKIALGCGIGCGVLVVLAGIALVAIGTAIETGGIPDTVALPRGKIPPKVLKQLVEMEVVEPDETVLYFYSAGMWSIEEDGNLFTDRRVISYSKSEDRLEIASAAYDEVTDIEFDPSDSWFEDSVITVTEEDGEWFVLWVSTESKQDRAFYDRLVERWQAEQP